MDPHLLELTFGPDPATEFKKKTTATHPSRQAKRFKESWLYECPSCRVSVDLNQITGNKYTHDCGKSFCASCAITGDGIEIDAHLCLRDDKEQCQTKKQYPFHECGPCVKFFCEEDRGAHARPMVFKALTRSG